MADETQGVDVGLPVLPVAGLGAPGLWQQPDLLVMPDHLG
jgi:hypothetical protein